VYLGNEHGEGDTVARIYTKTGDDGTTGRIGGHRVPKDSPYTDAVGSLDELSALVGVVSSLEAPVDVRTILRSLQNDLFLVGAELATPEGKEPKSLRINDEDIHRVEIEIDGIEGKLEPLKQFILPGGSMAGAHLHLVRAVARRTERYIVALSRVEKTNPKILQYLNRLSDLCFVLARYVNKSQAIPEAHPTFGKVR
jgi:cob(I)alamin adenosyltransferase